MTFDPRVIEIEDRSGSYPSVTVFSLENKKLTVSSNGDPFPALAGSPLTDSQIRNFDRKDTSIVNQNYDFTFTYRGGRNVQNPQTTKDGSIAILANGVTVFGIKYDTRTLPLSKTQLPENLNFDPVFFENFLAADPAGGNITNQGQYHYRSGKFLKTAWNTIKFRENNSYYSGSNFQGDRFRHADGHSKIIGYCFDGYPIYGPFGYRNPTDQFSSVIQMKSSYSLKVSDNHRPNNWKYNSDFFKIENNTVDISAGAFVEDYIFTRTKGTLDEHNGRFCVTPEYPNGTYAYFLTFKDEQLTIPQFPYVIGPTSKQTRTIVEKSKITTTREIDSLWTLPSGSTIARIKERIQVGIKLPISVSSDPSITVELISGSLPRGTRLEGTQIVGTAFEVAFETLSTFVLRAKQGDKFEDRTYRIVTVGADAPEWLTSEGMLPIGPNGLMFVLDNSIINFQLSAIDRDLPTGEELEFFIAEGDGELPPGISLSRDGKIQGITEPLLSIDQRFESGGYDTNPYGGFPYDFGLRDDEKDPTTRPQRKLNRYFPFAVTVTDGITFSRREFQIFLVGDDFLRSDNTIMKVATGVFTADNTFIRTPVWLTPRDLGVKRANNYITLYLDVLDTPTLAGEVTYTLENLNADETPSQLPPGTRLDVNSGEIVGRVPYQPAISETYKFTVRATRYAARPGIVTVFANFFEDTLLGNNSFRIFKIDRTDEDNVDDLEELKNREILINNRVYKVINVDDSNQNFDTIFLDRTLVPEISLILSRQAKVNNDHFFVNRLTEKQTEKYLGRNLKFSETEIYNITDIIPYIEYEIEDNNKQSYPVVAENIIESIQVTKLYSIGDFVIYNQNQGGDNKIYRCIESHIVNPLFDNGDLLIVDGEIQIDFETNKWELIGSDVNNISLSDILQLTSQALEKTFTNKVYIQAFDNNKWRIKLISNSTTRTISNIRQFFSSDDLAVSYRVNLIRDNEQKFQLNKNLSRSIQQGSNIGIALFARDGFSKTFASTFEDDVTVPFKSKTFEVKIIGEIDSTIKWITDNNLGTIDANFASTFKLEAETNVPDTPLIYQLTKGRLPPGMHLSQNGEIIGIANQFADDLNLGLTTFDQSEVTWDGDFPGDTTFDRRFKFTVKARDRFGAAELEKEFFIDVEDLDNTIYTNIYVKPLLKQDQRNYFDQFISNSSIFDPEKIYRPSDPRFGLQTDLKMLVFSGIEAKKIENFVAATAKNHKRKKFLLGDFKTAIAKLPGSNQILYEVVYIDVKDPADSDQGNTREKFLIKTQNKITADSIQYAAIDDETKKGLGYSQVPVYTRNFVRFIISEQNKITIDTRNSGKNINTDNDSFEISMRDKIINFKLKITDSEPQRLRPPGNTIKADSNAIKVSDSKDQVRYISNITNMRNQISSIGEIERRYLPLWMTTPQQDSTFIGYRTAVPICYCKPGTSNDILLNIKNSDINLNKINFDIDRYFIERSEGINQEQIILFANYQFNI